MRHPLVRQFPAVVSIVVISLPLFIAGCGGGGSTAAASSNSSTTSGSTPPAPPSPPPPGPPPIHGPVVLVVEENHGYASVIDNPLMPHLNGLARQYGLAIQYYANTHPSIGNYFEMTAGQIITNLDSFDGPVSDDNLVRHILEAGKTWKAYAESLPSVGYIGSDRGAYLHRHNPLSYFCDVTGRVDGTHLCDGFAGQRSNLVDFLQFREDVRNGHLPNFSFVAPNVNHDAHDGTLAEADTWLGTNVIDPLLASPQFQQNGLLVVVFDEAEDSDSTFGGGHIPMVIAGPQVIPGHHGPTQYQHQSLLRMIATYLQIDSNVGEAATAAAMNEFFQPSFNF